MDGFKYFIKGKIFEVCKNVENVKGLMIVNLLHKKNEKNKKSQNDMGGGNFTKQT